LLHLSFNGLADIKVNASEKDKLRAAAAFVIGSAASNNVKFQGQVLDAYPGPGVWHNLFEVRGALPVCNALDVRHYIKRRHETTFPLSCR
jgi:hypothetical protein